MPGKSSSAVIKALIEVKKKVTEIAKGGENEKDNYSYVRAIDLYKALQQAEADNGLIIVPRAMSWKVENKTLAVTYTFDAHHESGECIYNIGSHIGACRFEFKSGATDDKAFSKCVTSAMKYLHIQLYKIPTEDALEPLSDGDADAQGVNDRDLPRRSNGRDRDDRWDRDRRDADRRRDRDYRDFRDDDRRDSRRRDDRDDRRRDARDDRRRDDDRRTGRDDRRGDVASQRDEPPPPSPDDYGSSGPRDEPPFDKPDGQGLNPPAESPEEDHFRDRVTRLKNDLEDARTEPEAAEIWNKAADLVEQLAEITYAHFREQYKSRWDIYPPVV
jgi:hypothetical protein